MVGEVHDVGVHGVADESEEPVDEVRFHEHPGVITSSDRILPVGQPENSRYDNPVPHPAKGSGTPATGMLPRPPGGLGAVPSGCPGDRKRPDGLFLLLGWFLSRPLWRRPRRCQGVCDVTGATQCP